MNHDRQIVALTGGLVLAMWASGCRNLMAPTPQPSPRGTVADPCGDRLQDLCGQLLRYYSEHRELPQSLADLGKVGKEQPCPTVCPVSGKSYVYDRSGLQVPGQPGQLIVYDPEPSHSGMRKGILLETPRPGKPLLACVKSVPEAAFSSQKK